LTKALLASGASIRDMNCIRQHLSQIKGGRLALAAAPAHVQTFVVSDIPGDDPSLIASGPTLPASSSLAHARDILAAFDITVPPSIAAALSDPANEVPIVEISNVVIVASAASAFDFACKAGATAGFSIMFLGDALEGEARDLGREHGLLALERQRGGVATLILSGGETTVTLQEDNVRTGRGGRNLEYLLSLAICLDGTTGIFALACDTDGIDGGSHAAGAIITPNTLRHASALGFDAKTCLENHQSHDFFDCLGDLIVTGPTRNNVNDFRAILVL
jgi:hydroxypyruvate reductase